MNAGALSMLALGALGLWGGLALSLWNYLRRAGEREEQGVPERNRDYPRMWGKETELHKEVYQ